jgi:hypothetical protein
MRFSVVLAALAVVAPLGLGTGVAFSQPFQPFQGQSILGGRPNTPKAVWCANSTSNWDKVDEDCSFNTFAACQRALVNPNSGFCTQASLYGPPPPAPPRRKRQARR